MYNKATVVSFQILELNGVGKSISADWIGRDLYWAEQQQHNFVIKSYDLTKHDGVVNTVIKKRPGKMEKMAVNPYKR